MKFRWRSLLFIHHSSQISVNPATDQKLLFIHPTLAVFVHGKTVTDNGLDESFHNVEVLE